MCTCFWPLPFKKDAERRRLKGATDGIFWGKCRVTVKIAPLLRFCVDHVRGAPWTLLICRWSARHSLCWLRKMVLWSTRQRSTVYHHRQPTAAYRCRFAVVAAILSQIPIENLSVDAIPTPHCATRPFCFVCVFFCGPLARRKVRGYASSYIYVKHNATAVYSCYFLCKQCSILNAIPGNLNTVIFRIYHVLYSNAIFVRGYNPFFLYEARSVQINDSRIRKSIN